jgi:hypothetical protein
MRTCHARGQAKSTTGHDETMAFRIERAGICIAGSVLARKPCSQAS